MSDYGSEFEYAEQMDNELLVEQEAMLENPAPYEAEVAYENPAAAEELLGANMEFEQDTEMNAEADYVSEQETTDAILGD